MDEREQRGSRRRRVEVRGVVMQRGGVVVGVSRRRRERRRRRRTTADIQGVVHNRVRYARGLWWRWYVDGGQVDVDDRVV